MAFVNFFSYNDPQFLEEVIKNQNAGEIFFTGSFFLVASDYFTGNHAY